MNRRNIIIISSIIVVLLLLSFFFIRPTYTISIFFDKPDLSAKIYRNNAKNNTEIVSLAGDTKIKLSDGKYIIKTSSKSGHINENYTEFTVEGSDKDVSIKTSYSKKFMSNKIAEYKNEISAVLFTKYPELKSSFILKKEIILGKNIDWYAATYQREDIDRNSGDAYTVILKKENRPQIINTTYNTKNIPEEILSEAASRLSPFSTSS